MCALLGLSPPPWPIDDFLNTPLKGGSLWLHGAAIRSFFFFPVKYTFVISKRIEFSKKKDVILCIGSILSCVWCMILTTWKGPFLQQNLSLHSERVLEIGICHTLVWTSGLSMTKHFTKSGSLRLKWVISHKEREIVLSMPNTTWLNNRVVRFVQLFLKTHGLTPYLMHFLNDDHDELIETYIIYKKKMSPPAFVVKY